MRTGRPTDYTPELADKICELVAQGISLRQICKRDDMPGLSTLMLWKRKHSEFLEQYVRAEQDGADVYAREIIDIADNNELDPNSRRVMIDARKWIACKLKPRSYGDRVTVAGDAEAPLEVKATLDVSGLSTAALAEIAALAGKAGK